MSVPVHSSSLEVAWPRRAIEPWERQSERTGIEDGLKEGQLL
jgi:hypothetical protein